MRAAGRLDMSAAFLSFSARQADAAMLQGLRAWYTGRPDLRMPPILGVLTHIDLLSPAMEWSPPYNWREPARPKDQKDHLASRMGDELPKAESETLKGKLLKIERAFYVIESAPGKEVRVSAPLDPTVDDSGRLLIGEWIETQISSDLHVTSIKKSAARYTVEGDLIRTEAEFYTVADGTGKTHFALMTRLSHDRPSAGPQHGSGRSSFGPVAAAP